MAVEVTLRKWGNSIGIVFPKEYAEQRGLKPNEKIVVEVTRKADLSRIFGTLPRKMTGQEFKDMVREGWE
jgi:antitoxin component of MazEF toxin-antitoxin module